MSEPERWIVIPRWDEFQHYKDRDPKWIKDHGSQLDKDEYRELSFHLRGILRDLRLSYAATNGQLRGSTLSLTRRLGHRVVTRDLESLNRAGFIAFSASKPLALRYQDASLEEETEREVEKGTTSVEDIPRAVTELDQPRNPLLADAPANGTNGPGEIESISSIITRSLEEARNA